ncbi:MAG: DoxX family protein [Bacteroidetes bacterium]|nr:DoxX family protein [Bacteroidota bacterium]
MKTLLIWILRIVPALIMLQTLYFKFSASEESVFIFSTLGVEPWGRIVSGIMELIAGVLLLIPRTTFWGALIGCGVMAGAVMSHLFILGIEVMGDNGQLFAYAIITLICCVFLLIINKNQLSLITNRLRP